MGMGPLGVTTGTPAGKHPGPSPTIIHAGSSGEISENTGRRGSPSLVANGHSAQLAPSAEPRRSIASAGVSSSTGGLDYKPPTKTSVSGTLGQMNEIVQNLWQGEAPWSYTELMANLTLHLRYGWDGRKCIQHIQERRASALCNEAMCRWLVKNL